MMAPLANFRLYLGLALLCLVSRAAAQDWPEGRYCPCICAKLSSPELTYALGTGSYKQVDCRSRNVNDVPSSIPRDTQVLLLNHNGILNISDNIDYLYDLMYLDISNNQLNGVFYEDLRGNKRLSFINLGWNQIAYVSTIAFRGMNSLKHLMLSNNKLPYIPQAIKNLTSLVILDMSKNLINGVYINSLQGLPSLQFLNLKENRIRPVHIGSFYQVPQLVNLHLNGNLITYLPTQVFNGLSFLEVLSLHNNLIQNLHPGVFYAMSNIKTIDLSENKLTSLNRATFHGLYSLENLQLNANDLRNPPATIFQGLNNLQTLDISNNPNIGTLPYGILYGLHNLLTLTISHVQSLPQGLFNGLSSLLSLKMSESRLPTVNSEFFRDLSRVQILELPNNSIATLQPNSFSQLWTLTTLDLSDNQIKCINSEPFRGTHFDSLTTLYLQNNAINNLEVGAFINMPQLQELRLDNNNIPIVPNGIFSWRAQLRSVTLDNNQIHTIEEGAVRAMNNIERLTVISNYLSCDCHLVGFAKWFQQHWQSVERANEVYCYAPEVYNNRRLIDMINSPRNPFQCVYPKIATEPKVANLTKVVGENVYLHCHIIPTAVATLTWVFPNRQEVDAPSFPPLMNQTLRALTNHYGTLILYNIEGKDAGSYKCKATNTVGADSIVYHIDVVETAPTGPSGGPGTGGTTSGGPSATSRPNVPARTTTSHPAGGTTTQRPTGHPTHHGSWPGPGPGSDNRTLTSCTPNPCLNEGLCSERNGQENLGAVSESDEYVQHVKCECRQHYGGNACQYRKPDMPKEITVTASNKDYITLTWAATDFEHVQGYRVLYSIVGERTVIKSVPIHPTVLSYTMEELETDVSYRICVVAFNQGGESGVGNGNCIWAETQKASERTNSIFNMQLVTIGGSCLAVLVLLFLIGYGYQKLKERRENKRIFEDPFLTHSNRNRTSSIADVMRKSLRTPVQTNSFYRNSDGIMLIDLQGYPERQMYMNPMESRQSMHLGDGPFKEFVPGEPELFPKGTKRKTLKIEDTSI